MALSGKGRSEADLVSIFCLGLVVGLGLAVGDLFRARPRSVEPPAAGMGGWLEAGKCAVVAFGRDRIAPAAAGVTFFVLLALFPAISAFVSLYGLVANVADVQRELAALRGWVPGGLTDVVGGELTRLVAADHGALSIAFGLSIAVSIWSANAGFKALMDGLNVAYETREARGFFRLNLESLAFTCGAIGLAMAGTTVAVATPPLQGPAVLLLDWGRLTLLLAAIVLATSVIYRFGPSRPLARWRWFTPGGAVAAVGWLAMTALFSWYVASFGSYDRTYGSLGAIVGILTWVWLSLMVLLFGAELNNELEKRALI
ncbi:MAG TPA: YihY/virulence factor BrkB family protein [Caulobacteraceae bacterium]|jgi:membrane protein